MSQFKSRLGKLEAKMRTRSNYAEIIEKHAIGDKGMMVHTIVALYVTSNSEHKGAIKARNYLEWINGYNSKVIDSAYTAIDNLMASGLATHRPTGFISDGRDISGAIPPYPYLCSPEQIVNYSTATDTRFWTSL